MMSKRSRIADLPDEDLAEYLKDYYECLKRNKSDAELRWLANIKQLTKDQVRQGRDIKKLQNEAVMSRFEVPYDLKVMIEIENKV